MATILLPLTEKVTVTLSPGRRLLLPEKLAPAASARWGSRNSMASRQHARKRESFRFI